MKGGELFDRVLQMIRKRPANRHVFTFCSEIESLEIPDAALFAPDVVRSVAEDMASVLLGLPPREDAHPALVTDDIGHLLASGEVATPVKVAPCTDPASARVVGKRPREDAMRKHSGVLTRVQSASGETTRLYMCAKGTEHARADVCALTLLCNPALRLRELCDEVVAFAGPANAPGLANSMLVLGLATQLLREIQAARVRLRGHTMKK